MENNRNFLITIALSVLILTVWQVFYMNPRIEEQREAAHIESQQAQDAQGSANNEEAATASGAEDGAVVPGQAAKETQALSRDATLTETPRVRIDTPRLAGSINLKGARIDDLRLKDYHVTVDENSPTIELLNPAPLRDGYYVEFGYTGSEAAGKLPGPDTVWAAPANAVLTTSQPVTLTYTNDKGLTFKRTVSIDENYMFSISDTVENASGQPVSLRSYGRTTRFGKPHTQGTYILHEGLIGVTGEEGLQEINYSALEEQKKITPGKSTDGWLGITDKYW